MLRIGRHQCAEYKRTSDGSTYSQFKQAMSQCAEAIKVRIHYQVKLCDKFVPCPKNILRHGVSLQQDKTRAYQLLRSNGPNDNGGGVTKHPREQHFQTSQPSRIN